MHLFYSGIEVLNPGFIQSLPPIFRPIYYYYKFLLLHWYNSALRICCSYPELVPLREAKLLLTAGFLDCKESFLLKLSISYVTSFSSIPYCRIGEIAFSFKNVTNIQSRNQDILNAAHGSTWWEKYLTCFYGKTTATIFNQLNMNICNTSRIK